jgi:hypothetical protein
LVEVLKELVQAKETSDAIACALETQPTDSLDEQETE